MPFLVPAGRTAHGVCLLRYGWCTSQYEKRRGKTGTRPQSRCQAHARSTAGRSQKLHRSAVPSSIRIAVSRRVRSCSALVWRRRARRATTATAILTTDIARSAAATFSASRRSTGTATGTSMASWTAGTGAGRASVTPPNIAAASTASTAGGATSATTRTAIAAPTRAATATATTAARATGAPASCTGWSPRRCGGRRRAARARSRAGPRTARGRPRRSRWRRAAARG